MLDSAIVLRIRFREIAATLEHDAEKGKPLFSGAAHKRRR
jgi:hypothetical protein